MKTIVTMLVLGLALTSGRAKADPAADKLFHEAHEEREKAHQDREAALKLAEKAGDDELAANHLDFEAHMKDLKALSILKADAHRLEGWRLRREAHHAWRGAHWHRVRARHYHNAAMHQKHDAAELRKAAGVVHDQKAVADALEADAKKHDEAAAHDEADVHKEEEMANRDAKIAHELWEKAAHLDPEHKEQPKVAAVHPPTPPPAPVASAAAAAIK
jgi:hypothetical protein